MKVRDAFSPPGYAVSGLGEDPGFDAGQFVTDIWNIGKTAGERYLGDLLEINLPPQGGGPITPPPSKESSYGWVIPVVGGLGVVALLMIMKRR